MQLVKAFSSLFSSDEPPMQLVKAFSSLFSSDEPATHSIVASTASESPLLFSVSLFDPLLKFLHPSSKSWRKHSYPEMCCASISRASPCSHDNLAPHMYILYSSVIDSNIIF